MEMRRFGQTGLQVSALGYGAAPAGFLGTDIDQVRRIVKLLGDSGVNVIDVAECYANAEDTIGQVLAGSRNEWVIITKCGHAVAGDVEPDWSPRLIRSSIDRSLRRLRTDCIDVMLLHSCSLDVLQRGEAMAELVAARDAGKIRFLGYSGDNDDAAYAAELDDVSVLELSINMCDQRNIHHVLPKAKARDLGVIVKRPLANAAWKPLASQPGLYADYARTYSERFAMMGLELNSLEAQSTSKYDWSEIALRFAAFVPGVHTCVVGSTREENIRANVRALANESLPDAVDKSLRDSFREAEARAGETWLGQT